MARLDGGGRSQRLMQDLSHLPPAIRRTAPVARAPRGAELATFWDKRSERKLRTRLLAGEFHVPLVALLVVTSVVVVLVSVLT